ncbi:MAG: transporter, partial [Pseudophaeobacter sp.]
MKHVLFAAATTLLTATPLLADEVKIAVGCPPVAACSDYVYAEDLAAGLREQGMEASVFAGGALGKDPEVVDQLSQGLVQFGMTNFVMIKEVDPRILGFIAPYMFDDMEHFFRATQDTQSDLLDEIKASMESQGVRVAGLPGLGGTM